MTTSNWNKFKRDIEDNSIKCLRDLAIYPEVMKSYNFTKMRWSLIDKFQVYSECILIEDKYVVRYKDIARITW